MGRALVSILAHLCRWALQSKRLYDAWVKIVSILAHLCRWALQSRHVTLSTIRLVSILAHLCRWALQKRCTVRVVMQQFQSSPTSVGGRYADVVRNPTGYYEVSILAHLCRWALLTGQPDGATAAHGFNPRPPL